jgi:hypothetical protein
VINLRNRFDDYFYDNYIEVRRTEGSSYVTIIAENDDEMTQVILSKETLKEFIEHLQDIYKDM